MSGPGRARPATLAELLVAITGPDAWVRADAATRLGARFPGEPQALAALVRAAADDDAAVRFAAYSAVADVASPDVADVVARGLADPDRDVRYTAALALHELGDPRAPADVDEWIGPAPDDCGVPGVIGLEP